MTKILCVGDIHVSDRPPVNCTESYTSDIIDILSHVASLEKSMGVDAVVWAGDVFDHKHPSRNSHKLIISMLKVIQEYKNLWILPGNHDLQYDRLDTLDTQQPLGVLYAAGAQRLEGWVPGLPVYGVPWQQDWDTAIDSVFEEYQEKYTEHSLVVTHVSLFPPKLADGVPYEHIPAADLAKAMGGKGAMYYGHIHDYHGDFEVDGVNFCNVGAISRGSLTESHMNRKVMVALWDSETNQFTEIDVPHKPASEVFRVAEAEDKKQAKIDIETFISEIGTQTLDISSTASIIDHVKTMEAPEQVKKRAISFIEAVDS